MKTEKFSQLKDFLIKNSDTIQKLATKHHKTFLSNKKFRSEFIKKYQKYHIRLVEELANHLEDQDIKKGTAVFKKLAKKLAADSVEDKLTMEETLDGNIFLKQAVWEMLSKNNFLNSMSTADFYHISQRIGTYNDILTSILGFYYHRQYLKNLMGEIKLREKAELEIRKSNEINERYAAIVESSDDAIISKSLDGKITGWNKGAEKLYGYSAQEIIGKPVSVLMPTKQLSDFKKIMTELLAGRKVEHYETKRKKKNGKVIDVSITVSPLRNEKGEIIGASKIARDITDRKKIEHQKDDFVSIATHELKTPVTSIKAYAQVLHSIFLKNNDRKSAEYLSKMDAQLNKLTSLISDLLDVNRLQTGQIKLQEERFDFNSLISEITEELQRTTNKHALVLKLSDQAIVYGDRDRLGQVLTNLISNAIKYSPHSKKIIISSKTKQDQILVSVQDFGVGIPAEKQPQVFEKFFRVSGPKQDTYPGMGLGLYISSEIIKRQNGRIWVESTEGKGSTFCFSLPVSGKMT